MKGKFAVREQQRASEWNKLTRWRHTERGITTMDAVNAVQLFILVWTFTAVCQAEDLDISVSCDDVTGSVGKEVTLTCSVSLQSRDCSIKMCMFRYPNDSVICKQKLPKDSSFTCRYTPTTAMTEKFSFFVLTNCGRNTKEFTVDISDGCSISCDDVTATVGKEVNLTCTVSQQCIECCITMFKYSEINTDSEICAQALPEGSCEHRNSFTCRYTPTTAKTAKIKFFVRIKCGWKKTEFTVDVTDPISVKTEDPESKYPIITSVVGCFIIILFITIITIICKTKQNFTKSCGFQKRMFLCIRHDEDNTTPPETVI